MSLSDTSFKFYNDTVTLRFDAQEHVYYRMVEERNAPVRAYVVPGVTTVSNILDHSVYLMPWATKMMEGFLVNRMPVDNGFTQPMAWGAFLAMLKDAKKAHKTVFEESQSIGLQAHDWIDHSIRFALSKPDSEGHVIGMVGRGPEDKKARNCGLAAWDWMQAHNVRWVRTERKIYSREHDYAGTMDGLAWVDSCGDPACCRGMFFDQYSLIDWKSSNHLRVEYLYQTAAYQNAEQEEFGKQIDARWILQLGKDTGKFKAWYETDFARDFAAFRACLILYRLHNQIEEETRRKYREKRNA